MYAIYLNGELIGTTALETGDPPMGVASGAVMLVWPPPEIERNLLSRGAIDEAGLLVLKDRPDLVVKDENGEIVRGSFCYFGYAAELIEGQIDVCGIHHQEYQDRFPVQHEKYWGPSA